MQHFGMSDVHCFTTPDFNTKAKTNADLLRYDLSHYILLSIKKIHASKRLKMGSQAKKKLMMVLGVVHMLTRIPYYAIGAVG